MGRVVRRRGGAFQAPKRQIANDGADGSFAPIAIVSFGASIGPTKAILSGGLVLLEPALTLVRTRGAFVLSMLASGGATNEVTGAFGMIVVSSDAFAVGVTAVPGPLTDIENDWVVYEPFALSSEATNPAADSQISNWKRQFDSRGMRKLKFGEVLAFVIEAVQSDATTGTVLRLAAHFRIQAKL